MATKIGTWDDERIILIDESDRHHGPFIWDDVIALDDAIFRVIDGGKWRLLDVTNVWQHQADAALLADIEATQDAASYRSQ